MEGLRKAINVLVGIIVSIPVIVIVTAFVVLFIWILRKIFSRIFKGTRKTKYICVPVSGIKEPMITDKIPDTEEE